MSVRERLLTTLRGGDPGRTPLTIYDWMLPRGTAERSLREQGVGLISRLPAHRVLHREVEIRTREYVQNGQRFIHRSIHTPVGDVWQTLQPEGAYDTSNWIKEHFIKGPDDYRVMEFYIRDGEYLDTYDVIQEGRRRMGDDGIVLVRVAKSPIQEMLYQMLGYEQFAVDYYHQRDLFESLHATMVDRYAELYRLAASAPVEVLMLGDNITSDVVGLDRFRRYLLPEYAKLRGAIKDTDKLLAVHMDGRLKALAAEIARAEVDVVEALTPPPMGDFSIAKAREAWPGKALWINFTSSMHIESAEAIEEHTRELLAQAGSRRGFAISVTEDAPVEALERSLAVIARVLQEQG